MTYVITQPCIGTKDASCVDVCPVDCIHPTQNEEAFEPQASRATVKGPYDLSLVEGAVTTPHDAEGIHQVRQASKFLIRSWLHSPWYNRISFSS